MFKKGIKQKTKTPHNLSPVGALVSSKPHLIFFSQYMVAVSSYLLWRKVL